MALPPFVAAACCFIRAQTAGTAKGVMKACTADYRLVAT